MEGRMEIGFVSGFWGPRIVGAQTKTGRLCLISERSSASSSLRRRIVCNADAGQGADGGQGGAKKDTPGGGGVPEENFAATISKVIDASFRKVWLVLITKGVGDAYFATLQSFILGVMAAYKKGFTLPALQMELQMNKLTVKGDDEMNKLLELKENEKKTRYIWILLIYLVLKKVNFPSKRKNMTVPKDELVPSLEILVDEVTNAYKRGFSFDGLKMELTLNRPKNAPEINADAASIRSQWMRIVYLTNQLVSSNQEKGSNNNNPGTEK